MMMVLIKCGDVVIDSFFSSNEMKKKKLSQCFSTNFQ